MSSLVGSLEFVQVYIDDLLTITKSTYEDHLSKLRQVLERLQDANLRVNANKSSFTQEEVEYLGYILTRQGIKPIPEKVSTMLAIESPKNAKELW